MSHKAKHCTSGDERKLIKSDHPIPRHPISATFILSFALTDVEDFKIVDVERPAAIADDVFKKVRREIVILFFL